MKIDIHIHTTFSPDGFIKMKDAVLRAKSAGLNCIAITDHNTVLGHRIAKAIGKKYDFPVILGAEIKTVSGDIIALDVSEQIKPKMSIEETIDCIHDSGGIAVAAHPYSYLLYHKGIGRRIQDCKIDAVEAFNARTIIGNGITQKLAARNRIPMVAGSDAHLPEEIGNAYTVVDAHDIAGALKEIKRGRTEICGRAVSVYSVLEWYHKRLYRNLWKHIRVS